MVANYLNSIFYIYFTDTGDGQRSRYSMNVIIKESVNG
jgi:hypothetical protein